MRGKGIYSGTLHLRDGITPAYAGKSYHGGFHFFAVEDHPRLCGEKRFEMQCIPHHTGSPPPMRGKAFRTAMYSASHRITPAYAGKSGRVCGLKICHRDHPRLCGEKVHAARCFDLNTGSPPPMRGKVFLAPLVLSVFRITPAYAGKRQIRQPQRFSGRDHPRLCGEKAKKIPKQRYFFHQLASFSFSLQYT